MSIEAQLSAYPYDQYVRYPAVDREGWKKLLLARIARAAADPQSKTFGGSAPGRELVVAIRDAEWDRGHFGFGVASAQVLFAPSRPTLAAELDQLLEECLTELRRREVKFVSARIQGDHLQAIHAFESRGFRYYDNVIWPVVSVDEVPDVPDDGVRLMVEADLEAVARLAKHNAYSRGHFYCDERFDRTAIDGMYDKWVRTSWGAGEPIAVIEDGGVVRGFFAFRIDDELSSALGHRYGRMRLLGLDSEVRGKKLGSRLFRGAMSLMKGMGAVRIDSGYSTKNHASAALHVASGFRSVYEELTLHLWL
jgi:L-amino acid N-acyltransferase YncA